jgi:ABC-type nitrate/sulfonate/bicarbonate transport system substrate-binding protein
MSTIHRQIFAVPVVLIAVLVGGCGGGEDEQAANPNEPVKVRLATTPNLVGWPLYGADDLGLFEENGIQVESLQVFNSGPPIVETGLAGEWDIAFLGAPPAIIAGDAWNLQTAGIQNEEAANIVLYAREGEVDPANPGPALEGKRALAVAGSLGEQVLRECLVKWGLEPGAMEIVPLEMPQIFNSFNSGEGAVAQIWSEFVEKMDKEGHERICDGRQAGTEVYTVFAVHPDFAEEHPEAAARAIAAIFSANEMLKSDLDKAMPSILEFFGEQGVELSEEDVRKQSERHSWYSLEESTEFITSGRAEGALAQTAQFLVDSGQIDEVPEVDFLAPEIARQAVSAR